MEVKKLGELCEIVSGGTPSRTKTEFWNEGTIPWIKISNIKEKYVSEADEYITQAGLDGSSAKMLTKGTVLYTIFATLGEVGILEIDACTNQAIAGLTVKDAKKLNVDYLYYYLKSKKSYVNNVGRGVAQNNINMSILKSFEVPLPELSKQIEIVEIMDRVSKIIIERQQELKSLDDLIKARFVELFGDPLHPVNYKNLGEVALLERGRFSPRPRNDPKYFNGSYPFIQTGDISSSDHRLMKYKQTLNDLGITVSKQFVKGTIVMAIVGATIGATAILERDVYAPDSVIGITPYKYNNIFLETLLQFWQPKLLANAPECARANINLAILEKVPIVDVDIMMQKQFAAFVKQVDKSKFIVQKSLEETQKLFDSLMQKYFG